MWIIPKNHQLYSAFAQDTVGSKSELSELSDSLTSSLMWRSKPTPLRTWSQRWNRVSWLPPLFGRTLKPSRWSRFETELTSLLAVIPANPSPRRENEKEPTTPGTSGPTSDDLFGLSDQDYASLKTSKATSRLDSPQLSQIWKKMVTEQRGEYSRRLKLGLRTRENGCSSSRWMTPDVSDRRSAKSKQQGLSNQVLWPTVTSREYKGGGQAKRRKDGKDRLDTLDAVARHGPRDQGNPNTSGKNQEQFPTPTAPGSHNVGTMAEWGGKGNRARENRGTRNERLNPAWVEQLMGLPTGLTDLGSWGTE